MYLGRFSCPAFWVHRSGDQYYKKNACYGGILLAFVVQGKKVGIVTEFISKSVATILFKTNVALYRDIPTLGNIKH